MTSSHDTTEPANVSAPSELTELSESGRVEAVLFLASSPMNSRKIAHLAGLEDGTKARTLVKQLNQKYDEVGRSFHIKQIAGGYQLMTRPQFASWLRRLDHVPATVRLSVPAMETLSVVAYRQPILKSEIEAVRGVSCGEMLRQLLDRGLVKIAGRSEELGRPYFLTTPKFLEAFGLANLEALPRANELKGRGLPKTVLTPQNGTTSSTSSNMIESELEESNVSVAISQDNTDSLNVESQDPAVTIAGDENLANPSETPVVNEVEDEENWVEEEMYDDDDEDDDEEYEYVDEEEDDELEEGEEGDDLDDEDDDDYDDGDWDEDDEEGDEEEDDEELEDHWEEVEDDDEEEEWDEEDDDDDGDWEEDDDEAEEEEEDEDLEEGDDGDDEEEDDEEDWD